MLLGCREINRLIKAFVILCNIIDKHLASTTNEDYKI